MLAASLLSTGALAQKLTGITAEPASLLQGGTVKVTVSIDVMSGINCGLRLHWGDGAADDVKINQKKDVPWIASHVYAKAGNYEVKAEPKTQGALMPRSVFPMVSGLFHTSSGRCHASPGRVSRQVF